MTSIIKIYDSWKLKKNIYEKLDDDDFFEIQKRTGISENTLKRFIFTKSKDARGLTFSLKYLNKLCLGLPNHCEYKGNWSLFEIKEGNRPIAKEASKLKVSLQVIENDGQYKNEINLKNKIIDVSSKRAIQIVNNINISNIPLGHTLNNIRPSTENEIYDIYNFAIESYGDCELNGPTTKIPWWKKTN